MRSAGCSKPIEGGSAKHSPAAPRCTAGCGPRSATTATSLEQRLKTADVVFAWDIPRHDLARRAPRLKWMHAHGAGVNHLMPLDWLPSGAVLTNSRGVHGRRATEYAAMAILMLNNRVPEMVTNQRKGRWRQCFNSNIGSKTLLIVGVGHIGGAVAKWAKGMDMHVIGVRRSGRRHRYADEMHAPDALPALLPRADFVLMSAPHTGESHHMIGAKELARMKKGAGLVNYSRANCVDYDALVEKLERGEMSAVLDVFDPEPCRRAPLCGRPRTSSSPPTARRTTPTTTRPGPWTWCWRTSNAISRASRSGTGCGRAAVLR